MTLSRQTGAAWLRPRRLSLSSGSVGLLVGTTLCATEMRGQWLYEQIDSGAAIDTWIRRILDESESLAFAGVLMEVGKRLPELFAGVLSTLFLTWEIWNLDFELATVRRADRQL